MKNSEKVNQILSWYQHENNNVQKNDSLTVRFLNETDEPKTEYGPDPEFLDVSFLDMFKTSLYLLDEISAGITCNVFDDFLYLAS